MDPQPNAKDAPAATLVAAIRRMTGETQEALAHRLGVSFPTVNAWENGRSVPRAGHLAQLNALAREVGVPTEVLRILVVDDDPDALEVTKGFIAGMDIRAEITTASDGQTALLMVGSLAPDLLLLDVMMPGLDGIELATRLRSIPRLADIAIVFVTALSSRRDVVRMRSASPIAIVHKPIDPDALEQAIRAAMTP